MTELELEAKKYSELPDFRNLVGVYTGFIAGANSKYVNNKIEDLIRQREELKRIINDDIDAMAKLQAQRDELLEALEYALVGLNVYAVRYGIPNLNQIGYIHETENSIAKAKGISDE